MFTARYELIHYTSIDTTGHMTLKAGLFQKNRDGRSIYLLLPDVSRTS